MPGTSYGLYARQGAGSLAPQMLLEEIAAAYELVWISKAPAEIEAFRRISPAAKIPVLVLPDGTVVSESAAILIHLTNAHPAAALAPVAGSSAHARSLSAVDGLSVSKRVRSGPAVLLPGPLFGRRSGRGSADQAASPGRLDWPPRDRPRRVVTLCARRRAVCC